MHTKQQVADLTIQTTFRNSLTDVVLWVGTVSIFLIAFWPSL
jgi:hypothetical protein